MGLGVLEAEAEELANLQMPTFTLPDNALLTRTHNKFSDKSAQA